MGLEPKAQRDAFAARWGQPCLAYNVEARFSGSGLDSLTTTQTALPSVFPETLNLCPPHALHVSIYALAPVWWDDAPKAVHWQRIQSAAVATVQRECAFHPPFTLKFSRWRVTPTAIIALADDASGLIDRLRERLTEIARHDVLAAPSYEIIHCTLARFAHAVDLPSSAAETLMHAPLSLEVEVNRIRIVRERVYPSLDVEVVFSAGLE